MSESMHQSEIDTLKKRIKELEEYEKVINCIKGENGGKCNISDFLPVDEIPENIRLKLSEFNHEVNNKFPKTLNIPFKNDEPCNNQSLGNQIPNTFKEYLSNDSVLKEKIKFHKMSWAGYPDEKVIIEGIESPILWEWKSIYSNDGEGVRIVISKFPNKRIPLTFSGCDKKYHLWICLEYTKHQDNENKITSITINKMNIHCISPNTVLNTKFEISTTENLIKSEISNGNIIKL
jgi:hypothetical protein